MKPWGRFIIVFIAYSFALLHTAVPHQHTTAREGSHLSVARCAVPGTMTGFLQMVFSADLGYGHLETFKKNADADTDMSIACMSLPGVLAALLFTSTPRRRQDKIRVNPAANLYKREILFSTTQFRAPPAA